MDEIIDLLWFTSLDSPGAESSGFPDSSLALPDPAGAVDEEGPPAAPAPRIASSPPALSSMSASPADAAAGRLEILRTVFLF